MNLYMQTLKHLLNTWILAYLSLPLFYMGYYLLLHHEGKFDMMPQLCLFGFVFSLPSVLLWHAGLRYLTQCGLHFDTRFLVWMLVTMGSMVTTASVSFLLFLNLRLLIENFPFIVAAAAATLVSVLLRFNQFMYLLKTKEYENNMV